MHLRHSLALLCALLPGVAGPAQAAADFRTLGEPVFTRGSVGGHGSSRGVRFFARLPDGTLISGSDTLSRQPSFLRGFLPYRAGGLENARGFTAAATDAAGRLWVASADDLGFIEEDSFGANRFSSLKAAFERDLGRPPRHLRAIHAAGPRVWFVDARGAVAWDGARFVDHPLDATNNVRVIRSGGPHCWLHVPDRGVIALTESGLQPLLAPGALPPGTLWLLPPPGAGLATLEHQLPDGWRCGTPDAVFTSVRRRWEKLPEISAALEGLSATCAVEWDRQTLAIGTQVGGVFLIDGGGRVVYRLDRDRGLPDNQVQTLWSDDPAELWVGTAAGYSRVESPFRISAFPTRTMRGADVVPRAFARSEGRMFLATSLGVFEIQPGTSPVNPSELVPLAPTPSPIWSLAGTGSGLLAGGVDGVWRWNGEWTRVAVLGGTVTALQPLADRPETFLLVAGPALHVLEMRDGAARTFLLEADLGEVPLSLQAAAGGRVFISTMQGRVLEYRLTGDTAGDLRVTRSKVHELGNGPEPQAPPRLGRLGNRIHAHTESTLFLFDEASGRFVPQLSHYRLLAGIDSPAAPDESYWLVDTGESTLPGLMRIAVADGNLVAVPLRAEIPSTVIRREFPRLWANRTGEGVAVWVPVYQGVQRYAAESLVAAPPPQEARFQSVWWSEEAGDERSRYRFDLDPPAGSQPLPLAPRGEVKLPPTTKRLHFKMTLGAQARGVQVETRMVGLESDWTAGLPMREFGALAPGNYEFQVRAIDEFRRTGPVRGYAFVVRPPWHRSGVAFAIYALVAGAAIWGGVRWRVRQLERQNATLNRLVEERTRELALASKNKSDFLATISHEIRNPLNGVTGLVELLKGANLGPAERQLANSLAACSRTLRRVFDEVLGFTRLEQGAVSVQPAPFAVSSLLEECAALFRAEAGERGATLRVRNGAGEAVLMGDEAKLRTILNNFVANALKYAPGGPIDIEAGLEPLAEPLCQLTLEVTDHGPGIAPEEQEVIFRKFVRGSTAAGRSELGAGLGLATCQALAQLLGGSVGVESPSHAAPGETPRGARFFFQVVLPRSQAAADGPAPAAAPASAPPRRNAKALVIEDQEYNQLVARSVTERLGYATAVAGDARRARELFAAEAFGLVLVDWDVPGAKGDQLAREIRASPGGAESIIVALTAHDDDEVRQRCLDAGMDAFLIKPLAQPVLARLVARLEDQRTRSGRAGTCDFSVFSFLARGEPGETRKAAREYLRQLEGELVALGQAQAGGDRAEEARVAHRLRAHASVVGARGLMEATRRLQAGTPPPSEESLADARRAVTAEAGALREQLRAFLR